jgi:hypothetical protein
MYRTYHLTTEAGTYEGPYSVFDLMELARKRLVQPSTFLVDDLGEKIPARDLVLLKSAFGDVIPSSNPLETPWKRHMQPTAQYMQKANQAPVPGLNQADLPKYVLGVFVFPIFFSWRHKDYKWMTINIMATLLGLGIFTSFFTMFAAPRMVVSSGLYKDLSEAQAAFERWNKAAVWSLLLTLVLVMYFTWSALQILV